MKKNKYIRFILAFYVSIIFLMCTFCTKKYTPEPTNQQPEPISTDILFIGHKGGGSNNFNPQFVENTLPSVIDGLKTLDGVEVDLQMSLDGTIWLMHNMDLNYIVCNDTSYHHCIVLMHDSVISKWKICNDTVQDRIYKLSELIDYWNASTNGFYISLHVKTDFPADTFNLIGSKDAYLQKMADNLGNILSIIKHPNHLFLEINYKPFCDRLKNKVSDIKFCYLSEGDFRQRIDSAITKNYNGISNSYSSTSVTVDAVQKAKDKGLFVQLWTPYYLDELKAAFTLHPNTIQTDNLSVKKELNIK